MSYNATCIKEQIAGFRAIQSISLEITKLDGMTKTMETT